MMLSVYSSTICENTGPYLPWLTNQTQFEKVYKFKIQNKKTFSMIASRETEFRVIAQLEIHSPYDENYENLFVKKRQISDPTE